MPKMISQTIVDFTTLAIASGGWMEMDRVYLQNRILGMIGETKMETTEIRQSPKSSLQLKDELLEKAKMNQMIGTSTSEEEMFAAQLMDFLTPPPSIVNAFFAQFYSKDPQSATDYFYKLCKENDSVKTRAIAKNIAFPVETVYGNLEISFNATKDNTPVFHEESTSDGIPKCQLCMETEGYKGSNTFPARTNQRIIRMNLDGESWGFHYLPEGYYNEHCIIASEQHRPLEITQRSFERLLRIVEVLPHYFIASNADLANDSGAMLAHDHYQGGRHHFAIENASIKQSFSFTDFPNVAVGILQWPLSVLRLQGENKADIAQAAYRIMNKWKGYSNEDLSIFAYSTDGISHHAVTPIARKTSAGFELDLVLRDNNTSEKYPEGIFHPHKEVQHLKQENIGLTDAQGLAILPGHLADDLKEVTSYLLDEENDMALEYKNWAGQIKTNYNLTEENVEEVVKEEVGQAFIQALEDASVFKQDEKGQAAFEQFVAACNFN